MLRPLILNTDVTKRVNEQRDWCNRRENWWDPQKNKDAAGDDPAFVMILEHGFRVVYTVTMAHGVPFRHLSISVESTEEKYPDQIAFCTIASMFGFTGGKGHSITVPGQSPEITCEPGDDWIISVHRPSRTIVAAQALQPESIPNGADNKHRMG